jgi:Na+/H+ antiporter NhaD/arsenite permease-like protein
VAAVMALNEREAIRDPKLPIKCGVVLLGVFAGFVCHSVLHIDPAVVALLGAGVLDLIARVPRRRRMGNPAVLRRAGHHGRRTL